jgi:hypothetical protein
MLVWLSGRYLGLIHDLFAGCSECYVEMRYARRMIGPDTVVSGVQYTTSTH